MYVDATEVIFSAAKFRVILRGGAFSSWFFTKTKFDKQLNTIFIEGKTSGTFVHLLYLLYTNWVHACPNPHSFRSKKVQQAFLVIVPPKK